MSTRSPRPRATSPTNLRLPPGEAVRRLQAGVRSRYDEKVVELLGQDDDSYERLLSDSCLRLDFTEIDPFVRPPEIKN